jgi:hypothetical protein
MKAIEVSGRIDAAGGLRVEQRIPVNGPCKVRVLLLIAEEDDVSEDAWLRAAARNAAFDFLSGPDEDLYTVHDGRPLAHEG